MKNFLNTLKRLLGLAKPETPVVIPTRVETLKTALAQSKPDAREQLLTSEEQKAKTLAEKYKSEWEQFHGAGLFIAKDTARVAFVQEALQNTEVRIVLHQERLKLSNAEVAGDDAELESLERNIVEMFSLLSLAGGEVWKTIDSYIRQFEPDIYYRETKGEYLCHISENKSWVKLPLLQTLPEKGPKRADNQKRVQPNFFDCPQLSYLELNSRVPMLATSLIDVAKLMDGKTVVPISTGPEDKKEWYLYIINAN